MTAISPCHVEAPAVILSGQEVEQTLERIKSSLVLAYLAANLGLKNIPLKDFMEGVEKKMLLACLGLTGGNQKNAAAVLGIKPTVLFEKMRKHGISRQQLQIPNQLAPSLLEKAEQDFVGLELTPSAWPRLSPRKKIMEYSGTRRILKNRAV